MSALGARPGARSEYHRTKWEAEELVRGSGIAATIFRPAVIFGPRGGFIAEIRKLLHQGPVIPIIGSGMSLLQPIWINDVASCFVSALSRPRSVGQAYELGGPETFGFEELVDLVAEADGVVKPKIHLSPKLIRPAASVLGRLWKRFPITSDQLTMLLEDNVCDITAMVQTFGIEPASLSEHLND
jgi:NADH dehydrogenase